MIDSNHTDIQAILMDLNILHTNLKFRAEIETDNIINSYLGISIQRTPNNIKSSIHGKHTFADNSNHPTQHKYTVVKFLFNRPKV
jgi:hypothetical protein